MTKRVAIVTAAGSGIGKACAKELATQGYELVLMARSEAVHDVARETGGVAVQGSVLETKDLEKMVQVALKTHGVISAIVNNTGHGPGASSPTGERFDRDARCNLLELVDEDWHRTLDLYLLNVVRMARLVTPHLEKQGSGAIVNISASSAVEPEAAYPGSSVIRRALSGFVKLYSDRYAGAGIRMNNLLPGYLDNWEWSEQMVQSIPMARAGRLTEIAKTAAFLVSEDSGYITGQDILVDGGRNRSI